MRKASRSLLPRSALALLGACLLGALPARSEPEATTPSCYVTGGGGLEICRSIGEPEGVFYAPPACRFASDVQILRLKGRSAPGPIQVVHHAEPKREARRGKEPECEDDIRALDPTAGASVRSGRQTEQLATLMPDTEYRFTVAQTREAPTRRVRSRGRRGRREAREPEQAEVQAIRAAAVAREGSAARNPMTVAGRDWAGDDYYYLFMVASEVVGKGRRHVLVQARTLNFEALDLRARNEETGAVDWVPFEDGEAGRRRARRQPPLPVAVLDEAGEPIAGNCAAEGFDARGLVGSINVVDRTYHYFYTDVLPADCNEPVTKRRMGLYLRTSRDVTAEKGWSRARLVIDGLPPETLMRLAQARGMERWAVAYSCFRPSTALGGPVADICLHYTRDLSVESIAALTLYAEPAAAVRAPSYLGLRAGGDSTGRYGREGFYWMTDRYGNLDVPGVYPTKGGFLTWLDRRAPRGDGSEGSTLYGRPIFWSSWSVQPR